MSDSPLGQLAWQGAALALGEKLADVGPNGYYSMSPAEWMTWCSARIIELKSLRSEIGAQPNAVQAAGASQNVFDAIAYPKNREFEPPASAAPSGDKSDTPRSDSITDTNFSYTAKAEMLASLCRQLERELNAARSSSDRNGNKSESERSDSAP